MIYFQKQKIPNWFIKEVEEYFVDLRGIDIYPNTILDIGANIGCFSMLCYEKWNQSHITCIEPIPFNIAQLRKNVGNYTQIISAAVREKSGVDEIYIGDNFVTSSFFQMGRQTQNKLLVECIAANDLPSFELVKIDTEGCEVEIIKNLNLSNTKIITLEYHSKTDFKFIKNFLNSTFSCISCNDCKDIGIGTFLRKNDTSKSKLSYS